MGLNQQKNDAEARDDLWSIEGNFMYRHHVEPGVQLYAPKQESFPIPLKFFDVTRDTHKILDQINVSTTIGMLLEIEPCQIHGQDSRSSRC